MKTDTAHALVRDMALAFVLLTRLPLPHLPDEAFAASARAVWAYPVVGAVLGGVAALCGQGALAAGLPPLVAAGIALAAMVVLSGAMHEDGLADVADGFWGGATRERRLEIMRDSRIGTYGTQALILATGLRWMALAALLPEAPWALVAASALGRAAMPPLMAALPQARARGLAQSVGRPGVVPVVCGLGLAALLALAATGPAAVLAVMVALLAAGAAGALAQTRIGGQTGDVLGATEQLAEIACLLTFLILMT